MLGPEEIPAGVNRRGEGESLTMSICNGLCLDSHYSTTPAPPTPFRFSTLASYLSHEVRVCICTEGRGWRKREGMRKESRSSFYLMLICESGAAETRILFAEVPAVYFFSFFLLFFMSVRDCHRPCLTPIITSREVIKSRLKDYWMRLRGTRDVESDVRGGSDHEVRVVSIQSHI